MKAHGIAAAAAGLLLSCAMLHASPPSQNALWIEVHKKGEGTTTIAMTEEVARQLLTSTRERFTAAEGDDHDLITRDMIRDVLDGRRESIVAQDPAGTEARLWMKELSPPHRSHGANKLVLEIYKGGDKTLHIAIPDIEIEASDTGSGGDISTEFGWKNFLPFLAHAGGAVYIKSGKDDTEIWLFVD